jgi:transcriptional regulator with XRE-family HTH domain
MKSNIKSNDYQNFLDDLKGYYQENEQKEEENIPVGTRIRQIRQMQGVDSATLAKNAGIDHKYLEDVESLAIYPDLGTIIKITNALKVSTGSIFDLDSSRSYTIIRKIDRKKIMRSISGVKEHPDYEYLSLSSGVISRHMEAFIVTLKSNVYYTEELSTHEGEEFLYMLEGAMKIKLDDKEETLQQGDSIFYHSTIPHVLKSISPKPAILLAVLYTGYSS